jgi:hypothetical protein
MMLAESSLMSLHCKVHHGLGRFLTAAGVVWCIVILGCASESVGRQADDLPAGGSADNRTSDLSAEQEKDLQFLAAILESDQTDPVTWTGATERLLRMEVPEAIEEIDRALRSGRTPLILAITDALANQPRPTPGLLDALIAALRSAPPETLSRLSAVLAKYEDAAIGPVASVARDRSIAVAERLGPVYALGAFPTREAVDRLMELADPASGEPDAIRIAAVESLTRLSGLDLGADFRAWREWWGEARDQSPEQWARDVVRRYRAQIGELQERQRMLAERYVALLGELYRSLPPERRSERLLLDLDDPLATVRAFAMERIDRLLRDSVAISGELRARLIVALRDEDPALRRRAAELLHELNEATLPARLAELLATEPDREVITTYLDLLSRRPDEVALQPVLDRLADRTIGDKAADAAWELLRAVPLTDELRTAARQAVEQAREVRESPSLIRLAAMVGDAATRDALVPLLDGDDPATKAAVAEGLRARGDYEPLLARADDPVIYPSAVRALADGPADVESFRRLAGLEPAPETREHWERAVRSLARRLDASSLLEADRILAGTPYAGDSLRVLVLSQGAVLGPEAMSRADRVELLRRLTPLLIDQGEALRALEFLDQLNGTDLPTPLRDIRFRAQLIVGRFDAAAALVPDPARWVSLLSEFAKDDFEVAVRLRDEINRRFADELTPELRSTFEAVSRTLPPSADSAVITEGDGPKRPGDG